MPLDADLLAALACPKCKAELTLSQDERGLICESCHLTYPIKEGVPVLLLEEAMTAGGVAAATIGGKGNVAEAPPPVTGPRVRFTVVEGKGKGTVIDLEKGSCRALGRSLDEMEKTTVFSVDSTVGLDDNSKKLVMSYVNKQFQKRSPSTAGGEGLGGFKRGPDFQVADNAVSRLHAMFFYDEAGVGILDLVSKNGTYVNGVEVESKILKKGDLVAVGGTKLRFEGVVD